MPDGTSLNKGRVKTQTARASARLENCFLANQTFTELEAITTKSANNHGFEITDFKVFTHLNPLSIQVNIRHKNPDKKVSIEDCSILSHHLDELIQDSSILNKAFTLEISSEGISEILTKENEFQIFRGFPIEVTYQDLRKIEQQTNGLLLKRTNHDLQINQKGKTQRIPVEDIIQVRLTTPSG